MSSLQVDFTGSARMYSGVSAADEFQRIFGFSSEVIRRAAWRALHRAKETDEMHSQESAPGTNFYHEFVSEVRAELDTFDDWDANREVDNMASPRAYRADGLGLAFAQGNNATGHGEKELQLKRNVGPVTLLEIRSKSSVEQLELNYDGLASSATSRPQTLWLVIYNRNDEDVDIEVSLPLGVNEDGRITGWDKRLMLDPVGVNDRFMEAKDDGHEQDGDVEVAISAR